MNLYHLTAIPATGISAIAQGSFTAAKQHELVVSTGTTLELYRLEARESRLVPLFRHDVFSVIRDIRAFRLHATKRDYLIVTSDSGNLTILSADRQRLAFKQIHCEPFGRSGCRRTVPGQFLTCEPRGRACMIGALERCKFAYILNRDINETLTISSPLESHINDVYLYDLQSLDVGFDNPVFVTLERAYYQHPEKHQQQQQNENQDIGKEQKKSLVYYELDLGLNTIVKKVSSIVSSTSSKLIPLPGHTDGPGGVLVCSSGYITYRNLMQEEELKYLNDSPVNIIQAKLPYNKQTQLTDTNIVCATLYQDRKGNAFFFLLCTEFGDLIKLDVSWSVNEGVTALRLTYFDSLPTPAADMTIFRSGFLFVSLENSDALLLKFQSVDVPDDEVHGGLSKSTMVRLDQQSYMTNSDSNTDNANGNRNHEYQFLGKEGGDGNDNDNDHNDQVENGDQLTYFNNQDKNQNGINYSGKLYFARRQKLKNLIVEGNLESLSPICNMNKFQDTTSNSNTNNNLSYVLSSNKNMSSNIRCIRRGIGIIEMSNPYVLSSRITNIFTFYKDATAEHNKFHKYIIVSFKDKTKVLNIEASKVEEMMNSGFLSNVSTLYAGLIGYKSYIQIHTGGIRFLMNGSKDQMTEWKPPSPNVIISACANEQQIIIILSNANIIYFQIQGAGLHNQMMDMDMDMDLGDMNNSSEELMEMDKINDVIVVNNKNDQFNDIDYLPTIAIPQVPPGRKRADFFTVGDSLNGKVRVFRINNAGRIEKLGIHIAPSPIESLAFIDFGIHSYVSASSSSSSSSSAAAKKEQSVYHAKLYVIIGTKHGAIVRVFVDNETGSLGDKRSLFLGPDRIRVRHANMGGVTTCFALCLNNNSNSNKSYIMFLQGGRIEMSALSGGGGGGGESSISHVSPLATQEFLGGGGGESSISHVSPLTSQEFLGGFIAIQGSKLRLLCIDLLHTLEQGNHIHSICSIPSQIRLSTLFHLSRTRMNSTIRRLSKVEQLEPLHLGSGKPKRKRPRGHSLFVVAECEQRVTLNNNHSSHGKQYVNFNQPKHVQLNIGQVGQWFSKLSLVRVRDADGSDHGPVPGNNVSGNGFPSGLGDGSNNGKNSMDADPMNNQQAAGQGEGGGEEEDEEFDESDPLVNFSMDAVTILDSVAISEKDSKDKTGNDTEQDDCIIAIGSTAQLGTLNTNTNSDNETISYVVISKARKLSISATSINAANERKESEYGILSLYRVTTKMQLVHVHDTRIPQAANVITPFRDMIAVGLGANIRLYAMGKKQMLKKVEFRSAVRNKVCAICISGGDRLFVADKQESVTLFKYIANQRQQQKHVNVNGNSIGGHVEVEIRDGGKLLPIASDEISRWITCLHTLDYSSVVGGDLFGNIFILRLPSEITPGAEELATNGYNNHSSLANNHSGSNASGNVICGASMTTHKLKVEACIHIGCAISSITTGYIDNVSSSSSSSATNTESGSPDMNIIYGTMGGAIGVIKALFTKNDADFAKRLQMAMRKGWRSLVGRDHLSFRSSFYTTRSIVDGDLCELFTNATHEERTKWAEAVGRSDRDVDRKLDELRSSIV